MNARAALDRVFDPIDRGFTPAAARKIVGLRADAGLRALLQEFAEKGE